MSAKGMACKVCQSEDAPVRFRLCGDGVIVRRCRSCGFTFVDYRADEEHLPSSEHDPAGVPDALPGCEEKWKRRLRIYREARGAIANKKTLDVGAGGGSWLAAARAEGARVEGIEFCTVCREYARNQFGLELDTRSLEDERWRRRAAEFDLVTSWDVLEHVNDPAGFLRLLLGLVRPGGALMLSTPVRDTWFDRAGEAAYGVSFGRVSFLLRQRYSHAHLQIFHSRQLERLLTEAGARKVFYRKVHELTFPPERYFQNMYGRTRTAAALAVVARGCLAALPLENKVLGLFEKR